MQDLHKIYKTGDISTHALKGVSFRLLQGEFASIQGPSGSGKTTLMNLLGLLDTPTRGRIIINEKDTASMTELEMTLFRGQQVGFVFQFYNLVPVMNAIENVMLPLAVGKIPIVEQDEKAKHALKLVDLQDRMHHRPHELSAGEQQRVCIARALVTKPAVVLADEPTGNLDQETGKDIMELFVKLNAENNQTFLIITHNPVVASKTRRILYIEDGRIVQDQTNVLLKEEVRPVSIFDQVAEYIKDKNRETTRIALTEIAARLDLQPDQAETVIERMIRRNVLIGHIDGEMLVLK